jgi:hypothetical protein
MSKSRKQKAPAIVIRYVPTRVLRDYAGVNWMWARNNGFPMPDGEIWIDAGMSKKKQEQTLRHELFEVRRMMKGQQYWKAHTAALSAVGNPVSAQTTAAAASTYAGFHGNNPRKARKVSLPQPQPGQSLIAIGVLDGLQYTPYGSSGRKGIHFTHRAGDIGDGKNVNAKTILATDDRGENLYLIPQHPEYPKFSARGILG